MGVTVEVLDQPLDGGEHDEPAMPRTTCCGERERAVGQEVACRSSWRRCGWSSGHREAPGTGQQAPGTRHRATGKANGGLVYASMV